MEKLEQLKFGEEIVLRKNISLQKAFRLMQKNERYAFRLSFEKGTLKARRVIPETGCIANCLVNLICGDLPRLWSMGNVSCIVGKRGKEADMSLMPHYRRVTGKYIYQGYCTLVGEISFNKNRLLRSLRQWLGESTAVKIAIGIKLGKENWFYMFVRDQPDHIEINLNKLEAGVNDSVKIPLNELYDGSPDPKPDGDHITLNLQLLFDEIKRNFNK